MKKQEQILKPTVKPLVPLPIKQQNKEMNGVGVRSTKAVLPERRSISRAVSIPSRVIKRTSLEIPKP
jgi:hypothetical protein